MNIPIVFEDEDLLVIDKPAGVVVNTATSVKGETVQDWAKEKFRIQNSEFRIDDNADFFKRVGIVHRIDKETSGILLIAKNEEAFINLQSQFTNRTIQKTYLAIVHGDAPPNGIISAPIGRLPWNREQFGVVPEGKASETRYTKVHTGRMTSDPKSEGISVLTVNPTTGRTHQIRVHMKYIGHPLVGDYLYAGRKTSRNDRASVGRVLLHAWKMRFIHPKTQDFIDVIAPIPSDMRLFIPEEVICKI